MIEPFAAHHVDGAAALLVERHSRHRAAEPLLAALDLAGAVEAVRDAWARERTSGAAAVRDGRVAGYVIGTLRRSDAWGEHAWIEPAGHAAIEPERQRDLFAAAAGPWVEAGAKLHLALVPALPDLLDPWYRLGFGQMQLEAIRESGSARDHPAPAGVTIRSGGVADVDAVVATLASLIWRHQRLPPAFTGLVPPAAEELREAWRETLAESGVRLFLAERRGGLVGHVLLRPAEPALGVPPGAVELAAMATVPEVRGTGVGLALVDHALDWAAAAGHPVVTTDWRVTNLLSSRFWPARGFRPTFHRLHRVVGW